jgi:hypothetical protein
MHGLVNKLIQCFVEDTYDRDAWDMIVRESQLEFRDFEAMLVYDNEITDRVLIASGQVLGKSREAVLEDIGAYLVTHDSMRIVRRLLRFGGHTFEDFLASLDDLPDRVKLAIPDLEVPQLDLRDYTRHQHTLTVTWKLSGYGSVLLGLLRALADDYGALVLLDIGRTEHGTFSTEVIRIELLDVDFAEGRSFSLSAGGMR